MNSTSKTGVCTIAKSKPQAPIDYIGKKQQINKHWIKCQPTVAVWTN